ncbi:MAG: AraC family transcriptional regulator [Muribaculaceae bacterium]|nr:AraC family transcriptional regulator [Muribaculaceae bacterium]
MDKILNLQNLAHIEPFSSQFALLSGMYLLTRIEVPTESNAHPGYTHPLSQVDTPFRLDGLLVLSNAGGQIELNANTDTYALCANDIVIVRPGTLISFANLQAPIDFTLLFISTDFLNSLNIDLNSLEIKALVSRPRNVMRMSKNGNELIRKYFDLLQQNASKPTDYIFRTRIARMLISAMTYETLGLALNTHTDDYSFERVDSDPEATTRIQNYVYHFIQLVHVHYNKHRNIEFYARELCITPKYLSMVTKQITGQTAARWLSRVTVQHAKNMLRYSDKTVQQIAYDLNFPSQSAFGKYFKRFTGMSPSAYIKSFDK